MFKQYSCKKWCMPWKHAALGSKIKHSTKIFSWRKKHFRIIYTLVLGVNASKRPCSCLYFGVGGWGGGGGNKNLFDFNYMVRSLALPDVVTFSCTSTHKSCYAAGRSLALPQIRHASSCYAAGRSLAKKGTFPRSSQDTKLQFCCGKTLDFPILRRPFHGILMEICWRKWTCANYYGFGQFHHHPVIVWCHNRHGFLQALKPCFKQKIHLYFLYTLHINTYYIYILW